MEVVVGKLAGGISVEEVADEYGLEGEEVLAALSYAAHAVASEEIRAVS